LLKKNNFKNMKIRNGYVSNSSSSSFLICSKEELTKNSLMEISKVDKDSPFYNIIEDIAEFFVNNSEKQTIEKIKEEYTYDNEIEDYGQKLIDYINNGFNVYTGSACDDEIGIESYICDQYFDIKKENFILKKENSY